MSKSKNTQELVKILVIALRHKIGSIVNENEIYAQRYAKDAEVFLAEARKTANRENWNSSDKIVIKEQLAKKLKQELESKTFLNEKKFEIMDAEILSTLKDLKLF
jgi:hypothetical protein